MKTEGYLKKGTPRHRIMARKGTEIAEKMRLLRHLSPGLPGPIRFRTGRQACVQFDLAYSLYV